MADVLARITLAVAALAIAALMALEIGPARMVDHARKLVNNRGAAHLSAAQREGIARDLADAASLRPGSDAFQFAAGYASLDGRTAEALRYGRRAVEREPENTSAWIVYGYAQARAGDRAGAERSFQRVKQLNPRYLKPRLQ
jgi:tetratricopeptide (TPR) repeat protein